MNSKRRLRTRGCIVYNLIESVLRLIGCFVFTIVELVFHYVSSLYFGVRGNWCQRERVRFWVRNHQIYIFVHGFCLDGKSTTTGESSVFLCILIRHSILSGVGDSWCRMVNGYVNK